MKSTNSKTIEIVVSPTGKSRVETKGFVGSDCQEASRSVEQALGKQESETVTGEYFESHINENTHLKREG